ncbi:YwqG family protein [Risungbinella massiliensis]|uniref:YwqG family protein n=1 Tax=Risungbinella massiliensis TaxID=1329796 RepID=UPI0005CB8CA5|nr:YwqG family protein [Risungbinella massiliensis]
MNKIPKLSLPKEFEPYRKNIEDTVRPYIRISPKKDSTNVYQSKFLGKPYLPKTIEHPKDSKGKPMVLLAQLNFEEIPALEHMPDHGILQFYIPAEDDLLGLDFDNMTKQSDFRVLYHSEIIEDESLLVTDFSYLDHLDTEYFPLEEELSLSFQIEYEPISYVDFRFNEWLSELVELDNDEFELWEVYHDTFPSCTGHKIGGYPFFTQFDPRGYHQTLQEHEILLLQIDSDDDMGIMWGDAGVANFFIKKDDLLKLDFLNVAYTWDCS